MKTKAVLMTGTGDPDVLQMREIDIVWPRQQGDVLVRLMAAGLNPADTFFRALGTYVESDGPVVLGHDGAGVVEAVGAGVTEVSIGDRVCFCNGGIGGDPGTYSEFAVVPQDLLVKLPDAVDFHTAAAFPLVAITAWEALVERAGVGQAEQVLIHGGAGGTGQMAIQVARLRGARVAATVSTEEKAELVSSLGVERSILYKSEPFVKASMDWTNERGLDVALDNVGPEVMIETFGAMAPYGRVVTLMGTPADDTELTAYNRNLSIHNVMMLTPMWFGLHDHMKRQADIVRQLVPRLVTGEIRVNIQAVYPLADAAEAHRKLEQGGSSGKIVLSVSE